MKSLVEVMIVLLFSTLLALGCYQVYQRFQASYQQLSAERLQSETATLALHWLTQAIHQAGYIGCVGSGSPAKLINHVPNFSFKPLAIEHQGAQLVTSYASPKRAVLLTPSQPKRLTLDNTLKFSPKTVILVADCQHAEIVSLASLHRTAHQQQLQLEQALQYAYHNNADVSAVVVDRFEASAGMLYRQSITGPREAMLGGITSLHVERQGRTLVLTLVVQIDKTAPKTWHRIVAPRNPGSFS